MFDQDKANRICDRIAKGQSLRQAAKAEGIDGSTLLKWRDANADLAQQYARARDIGCELDFEQLEELAAEPPPVTASGSTDAGWVQWKRLQIDTKKWALSKKAPKKYGDKVETTHQVGESVTRFVREIVRA